MNNDKKVLMEVLKMSELDFFFAVMEQLSYEDHFNFSIVDVPGGEVVPSDGGLTVLVNHVNMGSGEYCGDKYILLPTGQYLKTMYVKK